MTIVDAPPDSRPQSSEADDPRPPDPDGGDPGRETGTPRWLIDRRGLRRAAKRYGPSWTLPGILWRQRRAEKRAKKRGDDFRRSVDGGAREGYDGLDDEEFVAVNARQSWANWRTIPRNLDGRLPDRPLMVVDCCCGDGDSTAVLAWCCPPGSRFLGLDFSRARIHRARKRTFFDSTSAPVPAGFRIQNVLETLRDEHDRELPEASVDLINASGAVGCHFGPTDSRRLAAECARVLRRGGYATIDAGPDATPPEELRAIFEEEGFRFLDANRSCCFDRFRQLCLRRE